MHDDFERKRAYGRRPPAAGADRDAIAEEESVFATLTAQQAESRNRLAALQSELAALDTEPDPRVRLPLAIEVPIPRTPADKNPSRRQSSHLRLIGPSLADVEIVDRVLAIEICTTQPRNGTACS
jgi:hypothetical protein